MATLRIRTEEETIGAGEILKIGYLEGAIDSTTTRIFESEMEKFLQEGVKYLILHFEGVKYVNSTGMGLLIKTCDAFREEGGCLCLVKVAPKVTSLFEMLGLVKTLLIFPDLEEAKEHIRSLVTPEEEKEEGVEEFESLDFGEAEVLEEEGIYPVEFGCPICQTQLEIHKAGKFKCPKCGCYFDADEEGEVRALRLEGDAKVIEMHLPSDTTFIDGLRTVTQNFARLFGYGDELVEVMDRGIDEAFAMVVNMSEKNPERANELTHVFMVGNAEEFICAVFSGSQPFDLEDMTAQLSMKIIQDSMDEVEILDLPSGGQVLKMRKRIKAPLEVEAQKKKKV